MLGAEHTKQFRTDGDQQAILDLRSMISTLLISVLNNKHIHTLARFVSTMKQNVYK